MKRLFLLSAIAIVAICSSSCGSSSKQESQSDSDSKPEPPKRHGWYNAPLYGDVESVVETEYELADKFGEVVRGDIKSCNKYLFNEAGDVVETAQFNPDGSLDRKHIYKYNAEGNIVVEAEYKPDGSLDWKHIYKYDSMGSMIEMTKYSSEALLPVSQTVYEITYRK